MTEPCFRFFRGYAELAQFIVFVGVVAEQADELDKAMANIGLILKEGEEEEQEWQELKRRAEEGGGAMKAFRANRPLLFEMAFCRTVENYLAYLSETMALIFRTRPETLRSSETIRLDELLEHETMEDVISTLTDRRVDELS
jgi:hypothetical protein